MKRYNGAPVDTERPGATSDELVTVDPPDAAPPGTGTLDVPYAGTPGHGSMQYHRAPLGAGLTVAPQLVGMGSETKQAGAGRAFVPAALAFPDQSVTPMPDHRRVARPMPTSSTDQTNVIRAPEDGANG